jgi:hypothetical protein
MEGFSRCQDMKKAASGTKGGFRGLQPGQGWLANVAGFIEQQPVRSCKPAFP